MSAALRILAGPVCFLLCLAAIRFWFIALINQFRAAANRKPGVSWASALNLLAMILGCRYYTDDGEKLVERTLYGCFGFVVCVLLAMLVGWLAGFGS